MKALKRPTVKEFKKHTECMFLEANPTAVITGWTKKPRWIKGFGGYYLSGEFHAVAEGYQPKTVIADYDSDYGWSVR